MEHTPAAAGTPAEGNLGQGTLLEDKHPLDTLEEEEHQLEAAGGCSNS